MKTRKVISLTTLLSFLLMVLTGVVLFIVPAGRVAYWSDWHLWGLSKTEWGNLHITSCLLFCIVGVWHIYFNWRPIGQYIKSRGSKAKAPSADLLLSISLIAVLWVGTYFVLPPFSWVLDLGEHVKDIGSVKYGEPPYGHAELSTLKTLTQRMQIDLSGALESLTEHGVAIEGEGDVIQDIAERNNMIPNEVFKIIMDGKKSSKNNASASMPIAPSPGIGRMTLRAIAEKYNLDLGMIINGLASEGINAKPDWTLKSIAEESKCQPVAVYERIRAASAKDKQ